MLKIKKYQTGGPTGGGNGSQMIAKAAEIGTQATPTPWILKNQQGLMMGLSAVNSMLGTPKDYEGAAGSTAMGIDGATDAISNVASQFGPVGQYIGMGLQANKLLSNITGKITGLDGMTSTDVIMNRIPVLGLVNGIGGKRADTMQQDIYTQSQSQFGYAGTNMDINNAAMKSGKKYGMFSSGARKNANWEIASAGRKQNTLKYLIKDRDTAMDAMAGSVDLYNTGYANELMGGYEPLIAAKKGTKLSVAKRVASKHKFTKAQLKKAADKQDDIDAYQVGGQFVTTQQVGKQRNIKELGDYAVQKNPRFIQRLFEEPKMAEWMEGTEKYRGSHLLGYVTENIDGKEYDIVFPEIQENESGILQKYKPDEALKRAKEKKDVLVLNRGEGKIFTQQYKLYPRFNLHIQAWNDRFGKYKQGGSFQFDISMFQKKELEEEQNVESLKQGGSLIPEGALHKNLNHLGEINPDLKGEVTKKGIPIISNEEGGEIVQHAEIEEGEIIFQKSVTEKIEELYKEYNKEDISQSKKDELAIKAGKIIAKEIMEKTDDKVGLIEKTE